MKVFISHHSADALIAGRIKQRLWTLHSIDSYLDVIDPYINKPGEDLAAHIRSEMAKCAQLLAVVSDTTRSSQWVPWEIGVATEKDFPLATFVAGQVLPPEFLRRWPYLRSDADLDRYAEASKAASRILVEKRASLGERSARGQATGNFYRALRKSLGQ